MEVLDRLNSLSELMVDWHQELEGAVVDLFVVSCSFFIVMHVEWEKEIPVSLRHMVGGMLWCFMMVHNVWVWLEELVDFILELLNWFNEIGPSHLEFIHMGVGDACVKLLHLVPESLLLDVSSSDRFIPLVVESVDLGGDISNIDHESVDLSHLFHIRVTGIIDNHEQLEEVEE